MSSRCGSLHVWCAPHTAICLGGDDPSRPNCYRSAMEPKAPARPYAETRAAKMLSERLTTASAERWMSTRKLAKLLKIKQPSVISHLANGRLPIPVERAVPLALALQMDAGTFLTAVLEQRFPTLDLSLLGSGTQAAARLSHLGWLDQLSGIAPERLTAEQARIIGEVARDTHPAERWIEPDEVPHIRRLRASSQKDDVGFTPSDWEERRATIERHLP